MNWKVAVVAWSKYYPGIYGETEENYEKPLDNPCPIRDLIDHRTNMSLYLNCYISPFSEIKFI
jgi:hypothetical protein